MEQMNAAGAGRGDADVEQLQKCSWPASEGRRLSAEGVVLDEKGSAAEAILYYRRSSLKLKEAAALCPEDHLADKKAMLGHAQDLLLRVVYLESLDGGAATTAVDEHIGPLQLTMDLSTAAAPAEESVKELVAASGASGSSSALDEAGYSLVAALSSDAEMKVYIYRLLEADNMGIKQDAVAELDAFVPDFSGTRNVQTLAKLRDCLKGVGWVAPRADPAGRISDKLQAAVALETQAKELQARGAKQDALQKYRDATQMFQFVLKHDDRMKSVKVKEMVEKRISDLEVAAAELMMAL